MRTGTADCFRFGPRLECGVATFRLWAPDARSVSLECAGMRTPLRRQQDGFWSVQGPADAGRRYHFVIDDRWVAPDPASRGQMDDVAGESLIVQPDNYLWRCTNWRGRPWEEMVLYELHAGLLGGFRGVEAHIARLAELGVTAIELMPIADFPGKRSWGYDGVLPFAPDRAYGTPHELKSLVDQSHALGLMVILDVVYNHFGPEGNWLGTYARDFFRDDVHTPWGAAIDFRQPMVRRFFIENALYWINEFRIDGLRLDAVHAIAEGDWLPELAQTIRESVRPERHVHLVVENDNNDAALLTRGFDAQWNDDFHHAVHVLLTGEREGYYADYASAPAAALARVLAEGFAYQGEPSEHRGGRPRGAPVAGLPSTAFVAFLQNHDQIGNRAFGERLTTLVRPEALRAAIALQLLCPQIPLLFMGEECGVREPFFYFTDFAGELAQAVRNGRRSEFRRFAAFADEAARDRIPDPNDPATYDASRPEFDNAHAREWNGFYAALLKIRRDRIVPHLRGTRSLGAHAIGNAAVVARWNLGNGAELTIATNLGSSDTHVELPRATPFWGSSQDFLPAYATLAWMEP